MSWDKIWLVLKREYLLNFKRRSFLLTAFGIPLFTLGVMYLTINSAASSEINIDEFERVGYIDRAGLVTEPEVSQRYVPVTDPALEAPAADDAAAQADYFSALEDSARQQVESGELDAYFAIAPDYLQSGMVDLYADGNVPEALRTNIRDFLRAQVSARVPASVPVPASRLADPVKEVFHDLDSDEELNESALIGRLLLPFIFVFIYFLATNTTSQYLMSGVVEEKENRLMEILATSIRPIELLTGKLLGLAALSFTQIGLWLAGGILVASLNEGARDFVAGVNIPIANIALIAVLFIVNFMLFASLMLGIGAAVTAEAESRQIAGLFTFINVAPMALLVVFFNNPNGPLPLFFSFFPFTAAVGIALRVGVTAVPSWQIALSLLVQIVTTVIVVWASAKVFRLGMLMYGKRLTPREFWNAVREGRVTLTTASEPTADARAQGR